MAPSPATRTCCSGCAVPGTGGRASMKLAVRNAEGKQVRQITVDDAVFGITPNLAVLHQAFVAQRANQRRGAARTKGRRAGGAGGARRRRGGGAAAPPARPGRAAPASPGKRRGGGFPYPLPFRV